MMRIDLIRFWLLLNLNVVCRAASYACEKKAVSCGCGQAAVAINARIVNGEEAVPYSWPMMVSLRYKCKTNGDSTTHCCGGTILSESYILTAAHCVDTLPENVKDQNVTIAAGMHDQSKQNRIIRNVDKIIFHPLWKTFHTEYQYDIALLRLSKPLDLQTNSSLARTCLPPRFDTLEKMLDYSSNATGLVVIGWGKLGTDGNFPDLLQQVSVNSIPYLDRRCTKVMSYPSVQMCAGVDDDISDACQGDSGGPILQWIGDRWEQLGLVSYGVTGCGIKGFPTVYTRLTYFHDWIVSHIQQDNHTNIVENITAANPVIYRCRVGFHQCGCSKKNVVLSSTALVPSENALPFTWSMIVSIRVASNNEHICTGTIVENYLILTAAHCVINRILEEIFIEAGMYSQDEPDAIIRHVDHMYIHPNYSRTADSYINDVAILHLSKSLFSENNAYLTPICQPSPVGYWINTRTQLVISGWNITNSSRVSNTKILQQTEIYLIEGDDHQRSIPMDQRENQFYAGRRVTDSSFTDLCYAADPGSPVFYWTDNHWIQVGFASHCKSIFKLTEMRPSNTYHCDRNASCGCGPTDVTLTSLRVIGGEVTIDHSWPMIISIQLYGEWHVCSGTILSDLFVLTAAQCVAGWGITETATVIAGAPNLSSPDKISRRIDQVYIHPNYSNIEPNLHNIAIIRINQPLPLKDESSTIRKTCLSSNTEVPFNEYPAPNSKLVVLGWSNFDVENGTSSRLRQIPVRFIDAKHKSCANAIINETYQFCAALSNDDHSIGLNYLLSYDAGGPIMMFKNNHWEQIGIITKPHGIETISKPELYIRISPYKEWIQSTIGFPLPVYPTLNNVDYKQNHQIDPLPYTSSMIVSIRHKNDINTHRYTGTILTDSYILTAAHYVDSSSDDLIISYKSEENLGKINRVYIHPEWKDYHRYRKDNVALLRLSNRLNFTVHRQLSRARLSPRVHLLENTMLQIIDWQRNTRVFLIANNDSLCNSFIDGDEQQFCVRFYESSQEDAVGKPIFQWMNHRWVQIGIVHLATKYTDDSYIGVVTSLHHYYNWLESIVNTPNFRTLSIGVTANVARNVPTTYECSVHSTSCGCSGENVKLSSTRIFGGEEAVPYSWSMVVSIHFNDSDEPSCTGSILTGSYVLTSAGCVDGASEMDLHIVAGVHNRLEDFPTIRYVQKIHIHPDWNRSDHTYGNDIALLYVFPPLPINGRGNPALTCVPHINSLTESVNYPLQGSQLVMVGWGSAGDDSHAMSETLQQVSIDVSNKNDPNCIKNVRDADKQFCAGRSNRSPCRGDLGGPIFQWKGTYWDQVGITSYGGQCDQVDSPAVFTRLAVYFNWMESVVNSSLTTTTPSPPPVPIVHECNKASTCGCGQTDVALTPSRIVGGEDALDDSWPMIVSLRLNGSIDHLCGGTILSASFILTAAHCLRNLSETYPTDLSIAAGMTNRSDPGRILRNIDRIHVHPYYLGGSDDKRHDIALLHVDQPFVFESDLKLTKTCVHRLDSSLPVDQYPKNGTRLVIIGWGVMQFGTKYIPEILQQAQVFSIDNDHSICKKSIQDSELQFCAGLYEGGKDSCEGDSGGPIFQWTGQYWEQVGVVSYGTGCADAYFPGVYTRLSFYYDWIQNILIRNGEHLESGTLSSSTMTRFTTSADLIPHSNTISMYHFYKYHFHVVIYGLSLILFSLCYQ
ncbi:unnamed protein product [Adineta ricciae]|uniref:Peptidase S1 domain-containing protein n=1 Tax=Adineta ricciae TaxID=249248 RepID=A0A813WMF0_ADIRI|nr:unnamed protein product [Adineta ricciae]